MRDQRIRDPIHNLIKFSSNQKDDEILWGLLQQYPIQRLRRIRQLGFSEYVYPGASHSRLSHSLGTMQMARRMLHVLERNAVLKKTADSDLQHRATLCAALLHDVGHGPFSHVFEEVSQKIGNKIDHEAFTRRLIEETEIAEFLSGRTTNPPELASDELLGLTLSFFKKEPGTTPYSTVISSQLDADRLDFLMRDRYFTGVKFGEIDIEWLFDCLSIDSIPIELGSTATQFGFVASAKGRIVIEEFLSSYAHMYTNVYFHKTTRGMEILVKEIIRDIVDDKEKAEKIFDNESLLHILFEAKEIDCKTYMELDDSVILNLISRASRVDMGKCSELSRRFLARQPLRCFEPPKKPKDSPPRRKIGRFIDSLKRDDIVHYQDKPPSKGYKQYDISTQEFFQNILVQSGLDREPIPIGALNPAVSSFADSPTIRFYFESEPDRARAVEIWDSLGSG